MNKKIKLNSGTVVTVLFVISCVAFLDGSLFAIFQSYFKYIFMVAMVIIFLFRCRTLPVKQLILFVTILCYFTLISFKNGLSSGSFFTVISGILAIYCYSLVRLSRKQQKICNVTAILIFFYILLVSVGYYSFWAESGISSINPNTYSMVLLYITVFLNYSIEFNSIRNKNRYRIILFLLALIGIYLLESRGCLIGLIFNIFMRMPFIRKIIEKMKDRQKFVNIGLSIIYFGGALIPIIYCKIVDYLYSVGQYIVFAGKDIYTRYVVWSNFLNYITSRTDVLLLGFSTDAIDTVLQYVHNNSLTIMGYCGVIGFILYYALVRKSYSNIINYSDVDSITYYMGFLTVFVVGFTEVSAFWSTMYGIEFLLLCKRNNEK